MAPPPYAIARELLFLFALLLPFAAGCDRCRHQSKATFFSSSRPLSAGSCGYRSLALGFAGGYITAGSSAVYRDGVGCGACFQIRCKEAAFCTPRGVRVVLTDHAAANGDDNTTDFVLSNRAFMGMARDGMVGELHRLRSVDVEYRRIPCEYTSRNLLIRVEEKSRYPSYLVVKFLFQGGQTDIVAVDVAPVGIGQRWQYMTRDFGPIWSTKQAPDGPLQFRLVVTAGYDGKWIWAQNVLPARWQPGAVYDMGAQLSDIAQEGCYPCDTQHWN